ncbi:MAG: hypothetical protein OEZ47_13460 [Gammaproteobacteria bacterium]|nr:hypothetical protein [Gammaproteobacteria bacterium]
MSSEHRIGNYLQQCLRDLYDHFGRSWGKVETALNKAAVELDLIPWDQRDKVTIVTRKKLPLLATSNTERFSIDFLTALNKVMGDVFAQDLTNKPILFSNRSLIDVMGSYQRIDILFGTRFTTEFYGQAASRHDLLAMMEFIQSEKLKQTRVVWRDIIFRKRAPNQTMEQLVDEINGRAWNSLIEYTESSTNPLISVGTPFVNNASEKVMATIFDVEPFQDHLNDSLPALPLTFCYTHKLVTDRSTATSSFQIGSETMKRIAETRRFTIPHYSLDHLTPSGFDHRWVYPLDSKDPVFTFDALEVPPQVAAITAGKFSPESSSQYRRAIIYGNEVLISNKRDELRSTLMDTNINFGIFVFRRFPESGRIMGCICGAYGPPNRRLAKLIASDKVKYLLPEKEERPTVLMGKIAIVIRKKLRDLPPELQLDLENHSYNEIGYDIRKVDPETPKNQYLKSLDVWQKQDSGEWKMVESMKA